MSVYLEFFKCVKPFVILVASSTTKQKPNSSSFFWANNKNFFACFIYVWALKWPGRNMS